MRIKLLTLTASLFASVTWMPTQADATQKHHQGIITHQPVVRPPPHVPVAKVVTGRVDHGTTQRTTPATLPAGSIGRPTMHWNGR
jgi:hypothetical protein